MKKITIRSENSNQRIDKFLAREFFSYTRGEIIRQIKDGKILVNGKKIKPSYVLKNNDELVLNLKNNTKKILPNKKIKLNILCQNSDIIVINKPAGLQVHPSATEKESTLVNSLVAVFPEIKSTHDGSLGSELRPGIVHRLDKETSGVLIVAKNKKTFLALKKLFQSRLVTKKYLALVHGKPEKDTGIISKPLAKSVDYKKQTIANQRTRNKTKEALTEYHVLKSGGKYSLLEVYPKTGRAHQIRIHLSSIGHPIVGDKIYGKNNPLKATDFFIPRHLLHAKQIKFELFKKKLSFSAPIPEDFSNFIKKLF